MKKIVLTLVVLVCCSVGLWAQTEEDMSISQPSFAMQPKFKPRYAGASVDAGVMFTPNSGSSAFYIADRKSVV